MTPIEAMAKAFWDFQGMSEWDEAENWQKRPAIAGMRSALLALADCELPDEVVSSGWIDKEDVTPVEIFRAMLRSIANGGGNMCQAGSTAACEPVSASPLQSGDCGEAEMDADIVGFIRSICREIFGGNCAFADDDLKILAACSRWAVANGIPDEICPNVIPKAKALLRGERHLGAYGGNPDFVTSALKKAADAQIQIEEAHRADTDGAEQRTPA